MNVGELTEQLKRFDPSAEVITEGCDCWGDVARVDHPDEDHQYADPDAVYLYRSEDQ